ncbi:MAG: class I SAM-dependent methyltransferase [Syntrophales bacterium]
MRKPISAVSGFFAAGRSRSLEEDAGMFWNMSRYDDRVQDYSHWAGAGRWNHQRWLQYGESNFRLILAYLLEYGGRDFLDELHLKTALEWGCGGGANVRALCDRFRSVYGVDIAQATLDECERQMKNYGFRNFRKILFKSEYPESVLEKIAADSVDFILSLAVFQHFPSKDYTRRVLAVIRKLMKKGGKAIIQVRYFDGSDKYRQKCDDYARNVITMTSFAPGEFKYILDECGLKSLYSERDPQGDRDCHEYFVLEKQ